MLTIGRLGGHDATMFPAQAGSFMSFMIESPPLLRAICSTEAAYGIAAIDASAPAAASSKRSGRSFAGATCWAPMRSR
jgi:hypothetical protein